jgi:hypothetical protein
MREKARGIEYRDGPPLSAEDQHRLVELLAVGMERLLRARADGPEVAIPGDLWLYDVDPSQKGAAGTSGS